jgi:hypothetical protein
MTAPKPDITEAQARKIRGACLRVHYAAVADVAARKPDAAALKFFVSDDVLVIKLPVRKIDKLGYLEWGWTDCPGLHKLGEPLWEESPVNLLVAAEMLEWPRNIMRILWKVDRSTDAEHRQDRVRASDVLIVIALVVALVAS